MIPENPTQDENETMPSTQSAPIRRLVLSGGGLKGLMMLGALQCIWDDELHFARDVQVVYGTSVGAIIGYLFLLGYAPKDIFAYLVTHRHEWQRYFAIGQWDMVGCVQGQHGIVRFHVVQDMLEKLTMAKMNTTMTLQQLHEKTGKKLYICTFNRTRRQTEYLSCDTHPDMPCFTALRLSSAVPFLFEPGYYNGDVYADGGVTENVPLSAFVADLATEDNTSPCRSVVVLFSNHKPTKEEEEAHDSAPPTGLLPNILDLFDILFYHRDDLHVLYYIEKVYALNASSKDARKCTVIRIPTAIKNFFNYDIDTDQFFEYFSHGYACARTTILKEGNESTC